MDIIKPIFILAPARSGTTVFFNLFTRHRDTAFPEHFVDKYFETPWKFRFLPLMVKLQIWRYKIRPLPHEGNFWRKFFPHSAYRDGTEITKEEENYIYSALKAEIRALKSKRFVDRSHDFMLQIKFLNALFPDCYYIVLTRDPKAVVNSQYTMLKTEWKENGVNDGNNYGRVIEKFGKEKSLLESCINYYNYYIEIMKKEIRLVKQRVIFEKYEEFVEDPHAELKKLYEFVGLKWYPELEKEIPSKLELKNNEKWKLLSLGEQKILEKAFP